MSLPVRWGPMAMYNGVFPFGPDVRELEAALLNTQRTVQAFREMIERSGMYIARGHRFDGNSLVPAELCVFDKREKERLQQMTKTLQQSAALARARVEAERERDNARAALAECQKLNATLREELDAGNKRWDRSFELNAALNDKRNELRDQLAAMTAERDRAVAHRCEAVAIANDLYDHSDPKPWRREEYKDTRVRLIGLTYKISNETPDPWEETK